MQRMYVCIYVVYHLGIYIHIYKSTYFFVFTTHTKALTFSSLPQRKGHYNSNLRLAYWQADSGGIECVLYRICSL